MRSHQSLNKEIPNQTRVLIHKKLGCAQYQITIKIYILCSHCGGTAVIALDATYSYNAVSALRDGICHQELELPDLVPAQLHA
jgi:hypothetical protein